MDQYERNRQRIAMVGSAHVPPPEKTPLGTVIEVEPEWVCCCCDQDVPRPSGGMSVPVGTFCGPCFVGLIEFLFNGTEPMFLNAVRDETCHYIRVRRERIEEGSLERPVLKATTVSDVAKGHKERFKARLRDLIREMDEEDDG